MSEKKIFCNNQKNYNESFYFNSLKLGKNIISIPKDFKLISAIVCENEELLTIIKAEDYYCKRKEVVVYYTRSDCDLAQFESYELIVKINVMSEGFCYLAYME